MKKGLFKKIGYVIVVITILYIIYMIYKKIKYSKCYIFEEIHETDGNQSYVCIVRDDNGNLIRPLAEEFIVGDTFTISNTEAALNGSYTINSIWYDADGRIGCLKIDTPTDYVFKYDTQQGGVPKDATYFGIGKICKN